MLRLALLGAAAVASLAAQPAAGGLTLGQALLRTNLGTAWGSTIGTLVAWDQGGLHIMAVELDVANILLGSGWTCGRGSRTAICSKCAAISRPATRW